jgi:hypothetical protein
MVPMTNISVPTKDNELAPNFGWLMMDKKPIQAMKRLAVAHPIAMGALMHMVENMSRSNAFMASQQSIAKALGVTSRAIKTAVAELETQKFVQIIKIGTANAYIVNTKVAWQGNRGARFAHFHADIVAYEVEQSRDIDDTTPLNQIPRLEEGERLLVGNEPIEPPDQQEMELP